MTIKLTPEQAKDPIQLLNLIIKLAEVQNGLVRLVHGLDERLRLLDDEVSAITDVVFESPVPEQLDS